MLPSKNLNQNWDLAAKMLPQISSTLTQKSATRRLTFRPNPSTLNEASSHTLTLSLCMHAVSSVCLSLYHTDTRTLVVYLTLPPSTIHTYTHAHPQPNTRIRIHTIPFLVSFLLECSLCLGWRLGWAFLCARKQSVRIFPTILPIAFFSH